MSIQSIESEVSRLGLEFAHYAQDNELTGALFEKPDHLALRATDIRDFDQKVKQVDKLSEQMVLQESLDRFIVTAQILGGLSITNQIKIRWLEIIEPLWDKSEPGTEGAGHVEFYFRDFELARSVLSSKGVRYSIDDHPQPRIKVPYNQHGDEFRFTRIPIADVLTKNVLADEAKLLKAAA